MVKIRVTGKCLGIRGQKSGRRNWVTNDGYCFRMLGNASIPVAVISLHRYLWYAPQVLLLPVLILFLRRRYQEQFPIFVGYMAAQLTLFCTTLVTNFLLDHHLASLDVFQWNAVIGTGISSIFEVAVLYELAYILLLSRSSIKSSLRVTLRWAAGILVLFAAVMSALLAHQGLLRVLATFQTLNFSANVIKVGLLLVLLIFTRALQLHWRRMSAGIALGFAVSGSVEIAASALMSVSARPSYTAIDSLRLLGFHITVVIWLVHVLLPNHSATHILTGNVNMVELKRWNEEIQKLRG